MNRFLITIACALLCTAASAQPKAEDLTNIDKRLTNGFVMKPLKLTVDFFKDAAPKGAKGTSLIKLSTGLRTAFGTRAGGTASRYSFTIIPWFSYSGSWISADIRNIPESLGPTLRYSQNQYDIHLLMAAELKKRLENETYTRENLAANVLAIRDKLMREEFNVVSLMVAETNQGKDAEGLKKWDELVAAATKAKSWEMLRKSAK